MFDYLKIAKHYEKTFAKHGANAKGMDWPNQKDLEKRFAVMFGLLKNRLSPKPSLLDVGCGIGLFYDYLQQKKLNTKIKFAGLDISEAMVTAAKSRHAKINFKQRDIIENPLPKNSVDFIIMNGVMTEKLDLTQKQMTEFAKNIISSAFDSAKQGIAFNVMSNHVDWKRDDLFHWPFDECAEFLKKSCSRHIVFRADYGLYEYTTYVYKEPN